MRPIFTALEVRRSVLPFGAYDIDFSIGHYMVLTHSDLQAANIRMRRDGTVVLLDEGLAGFYPEYWEYCRVSCSPLGSEWKALEKCIASYPAEQ